MELPCPFCGLRHADEFVCHGTVPNLEGDAVSALYLRVDSATISREYWQHHHGCGSWLLVCRNPSTNEVLSVELLRGALPESAN